MDDILQIVLDNVRVSAQDIERLSCVYTLFRTVAKDQYPVYHKQYKEDTRVGKVLSKTARKYSKVCQVCNTGRADCFDPFTKQSVCDECRIPVILLEKAKKKYGITEDDMTRYDRYQYWRKVQLIQYFKLDDVKECVFYKLRK